MLVSKPTHGGGAPLGIDLDAGVAKIKLTRPAPPAEPVAESAALDPASTGDLTPAEDAGPARGAEPNQPHEPTPLAAPTEVVKSASSNSEDVTAR